MTTPPEDGRFPSTSWTLVARLKSHDSAAVHLALDELCTRYRYPLYCYLRRRGLDHHDAEDVLHDFLARFLRLGSFQSADETKGRLRGYLSASLARQLSDWFRQQSRVPRPADEIALDAAALEHRYARDQFPDGETPDQIFERKWALALLHTVIDHLASDYAGRGKSPLFAALRPVLLAGGSLRGHDSPALAASLSMTEEALRAALHRMLRDFRDHLRREVAQTVEDPGEIGREIDHLRRLFAT